MIVTTGYHHVSHFSTLRNLKHRSLPMVYAAIFSLHRLTCHGIQETVLKAFSLEHKCRGGWISSMPTLGDCDRSIKFMNPVLCLFTVIVGDRNWITMRHRMRHRMRLKDCSHFLCSVNLHKTPRQQHHQVLRGNQDRECLSAN